MEMTNFKHQTDIHEENQSEKVYKYLRYWPLFLALIVSSLIVSWIYLRYELPVFKTTATLLIKDDQNTSGSVESGMLEAFDLFGSKKNVENEVEVLQSKTLMKEAVKRLQLYAPITLQGRVLEQSAYLVSPIKIEVAEPENIQPVTKVPFAFNYQSNTVTILNKNYELDIWYNTAYGKLKFIPNPYFFSRHHQKTDYNFFFSLVKEKNIVNQILNRVKISPSTKQSTVIDLSIEGEVPQQGEDILNELLVVYNQAAITDKNVLAANTLKFVNERLNYVVNELDSVEGSLQQFKAKNKIFDISAQGQLYLESVADVDKQLSEINIQLGILQEIERFIKSQGETGGLVPATMGVSDPTLLSLLANLNELEVKLSETLKTVPSNHPSVISTKAAIASLKPDILKNVLSQRENLEVSKKLLSSKERSYSNLLERIPQRERELLSISRQQVIKNNIYTFLLQKREETALSFASAVADSRVIDRAESLDTPVSPRKKLTYLAAILAALIIGAVIVYLKEILTRTVQQKSEIERATSIPFLGEVNYDDSKSSIVITEGKRTFIAEQFRHLRTALTYMGIDANQNTILVTSSISGEGKSFIAINLGISLSLMGKKVILLELDLRKPKLSEELKMSRENGLSNFLIGNSEQSDIIKHTGVPNLSLISSGPIPPNPSELISNVRLVNLLESLKSSYDFVIMDTAPVTPVTDAFILSPFADVTLFVIRHDYTPKVLVQKLEQFNQNKSLKNPALIYNGIKTKGIGRYSYGYGYGYGYTEDKKGWKAWLGLGKK